VKNNDLNAAVSAVFDGEDISKEEQASQWDESAWGAGKEGGTNDQLLHPLGSSAAATRPNSPAPSVGNRANLHPTSKQEEDDDLAKAMAMSTGDLRGSFQQETGRVGADGQQTTFGPANRDHYDQSNWAMVQTGVQNTSEIVPDTNMRQRPNAPGEPRLLKHLPNGDYTPNLLTICHAINGARHALLMPEHMQDNYGENAEWWHGESIYLPRIVNIEDGSLAQPAVDQHDELIAEVQRLMAFLSASDRSYASIGALTKTAVLKSGSPLFSTPSGTSLEYFLQNWTAAASAKSSDPAAYTGLFSSKIGTNVTEGNRIPDASMIDLPVNRIDLPVNITQDGRSDLAEQLDELLWNNTPSDTDVPNENYIERPADVLVMRAHQENPTASPQLRLEVPAEFYIDKYLAENVVATRATRKQMVDGRKRISKIEQVEMKLKTWKHPKKNEKLETATLLKHTHGHFSGQNKIDVANADKTSYALEKTQTNPPHYDEIAQKLERVIISINSKLETLAEEKEKTRRMIADMSKAPPAGLRPEDLQYRYTLRGVATKPQITYVLRPAAGDKDNELLDDDTTPDHMQWWRMEYDVNGPGATVTKTKSADYDVIRAVELEHSSALLVYANDRVNSAVTEDSLPEPLRDFIARDNRDFAMELQTEINEPPAYNMTDIPRESVERTSLDSTRVEGGGSDLGEASPPGYEDDAFMDHSAFGLGHPIKAGYHVGNSQEDDAPVQEIRLDPPLEEEMEMEMVEKPRGPRALGNSDTLMKDAR